MKWHKPKYKFLFLPYKCHGCQDWFWLCWVLTNNHEGLTCPNEPDEEKALAGWHNLHR